jgi:hypothetical protein
MVSLIIPQENKVQQKDPFVVDAILGPAQSTVSFNSALADFPPEDKFRYKASSPAASYSVLSVMMKC